MMLRAVVALLVFASPAFAQHGGGRAGSTGSRGFVGHAGVSRSTGFSRSGSYSRPGNYSRPAQPFRNFAPGNVRFGRPVQPGLQGPRFNSRNNYGNRLAPNRPQYRPEYVSPNHRGGDRDHDRFRGGDRDHDRFRERRRGFNGWYSSVYPAWLSYGYPYLLNPGFLYWGNSDDSTNEQGSVAPSYSDPYLEPDYGSPEGYPGPSEAEGNGSVEQSEEPQVPLTVIFKDGRAAESIENYIMTATVLTDFDSHHYERIPLDQIDLVATQQANRANGIDFQIPNTPGD